VTKSDRGLFRAAGIGLALALALAAPLTAQDQGVEEVTAYQAWHAASTAGDAAKAAELARAYLEKFPSGQYAEYLTKWLAGAELTRFNDAIKKKDMAAMVAIGQERLKQDPNDLTILYWMALNLRQNQLLASGAATHLEQAAEFSRRAIELIEKGGQPSGVDAAKWNKDANLAWLHQNLALVAAKQEKTEQALKEYEVSTGLAPGDPAIVARNTLGCGSLNKSLYDKAVEKYQALPEAERSPDGPSAAAKAAIDEANANADAAIECWARFLGVTAKGGAQEVRARIEPALAALYQYRHPEAPEGYKALVEKYSTGSP
jgi:hypothetical protein